MLPTALPPATPSIAEQTAFYDQRWSGFEFANRLKLQRCVAVLDALARTGLKQPRIVDLGCGAGWLTAVLGHFGPTLGVELSPQAVEDARARYTHVRFEHVDLSSWDPPRGAFDVAVSHEVVEHLEDQSGHLRTAHDLLRPGGYLILTTPNATTFRAMPAAARDGWTAQPIEDWRTVSELGRLARAAGFRDVSLSTVITGYGVRGTYRLANSRLAHGAARRLGLAREFEHLRQRLGYGLHTVMSARK